MTPMASQRSWDYQDKSVLLPEGPALGASTCQVSSLCNSGLRKWILVLTSWTQLWEVFETFDLKVETRRYMTMASLTVGGRRHPGRKWAWWVVLWTGCTRASFLQAYEWNSWATACQEPALQPSPQGYQMTGLGCLEPALTH